MVGDGCPSCRSRFGRRGWARPATLATGAPDANGCQPYQAWQADKNWPNGTTPQWLQVGFAKAERAVGIRIREVNAAPFVQRIDLIDDQGTSHSVYAGGDKTACGGWLVVTFPLTDYKVAKAKVYTASASWEAIDAVGLDVISVDSYQYNGFNQLTGITGSDGSSTAFGYDGNGNQFPSWRSRQVGRRR